MMLSMNVYIAELGCPTIFSARIIEDDNKYWLFSGNNWNLVGNDYKNISYNIFCLHAR